VSNENMLQIRSEIGQLKKVLLHRPGKELETLTPEVLDNLLFDDIPWLKRLQEEHDGFAEILHSLGCEVYYYSDLLTEILSLPTPASMAVEHLVKTGRMPQSTLRGEIAEKLSEMNPQELTEIMIGGIRKDSVLCNDEEKPLSWWIQEDFPFYLNPIPNLYFTRDPGAIIGNGMALGAMKSTARKRESFLLDLLWKHHPLFSSLRSTPWYSPDMGDSLEGGDILVVSDTAVVVGASARTGSDAIETLAHNLFQSDSGFRELLVLRIPSARAYMHLDTVFTMVDRDSFILFPGVEEAIRVFHLSPGKKGRIRIREEKNLKVALAGILNLSDVRIIHSGSNARGVAIREQWNDSANTLAVKPGCIVSYNRNAASNDALRNEGIEVLEIEGSELVRGRGGPRCMSMPLLREE